MQNLAETGSGDRLAHLGEDTLESAQMGTSHTGVSRGGEDVSDASELGLQTVDQLAEEGATVVDLAGDQQSWRFGHVLVDEAQELSPMQWRMIKRRTQGGSITIVGDMAQRSAGPIQSWRDLLGDTFGDVVQAQLTINYRSPAEVNRVAAAVLAQITPNLSPAESIRSAGFSPDAVSCKSNKHLSGELNRDGSTPDASEGGVLESIVAEECAAVGGGTVAVIGLDRGGSYVDDRVSLLTPTEAKGLEFDSVIVLEPANIFDQNPSDLYVACTRSTGRLRFVHSSPMPDFLAKVVSATGT